MISVGYNYSCYAYVYLSNVWKSGHRASQANAKLTVIHGPVGIYKYIHSM